MELTKGEIEQLKHIAKSQPVFSGDLISKSDKQSLLKKGLIFYYQDDDLQMKGYAKGVGGYVMTSLGKQILKELK